MDVSVQRKATDGTHTMNKVLLEELPFTCSEGYRAVKKLGELFHGSRG